MESLTFTFCSLDKWIGLCYTGVDWGEAGSGPDLRDLMTIIDNTYMCATCRKEIESRLVTLESNPMFGTHRLFSEKNGYIEEIIHEVMRISDGSRSSNR